MWTSNREDQQKAILNPNLPGVAYRSYDCQGHTAQSQERELPRGLLPKAPALHKTSSKAKESLPGGSHGRRRFAHPPPGARNQPPATAGVQALSRRTCWQPRRRARSAPTSHRRAALPGAAGERHRLGPTRCSLAATRGSCLPSKAQLQPLHARLPGQQRQHLPKGRGRRPSRAASAAGHSRTTSGTLSPRSAKTPATTTTTGPFIAAEPFATPPIGYSERPRRPEALPLVARPTRSRPGPGRRGAAAGVKRPLARGGTAERRGRETEGRFLTLSSAKG